MTRKTENQSLRDPSTSAHLIRRRRLAGLRLLCSTLFASLSIAAYGQVTTYHYDNNRTGANLSESILTTANVNTTTFGKLFSLAVDGQIYAQPLYVPSVSISQQGVHNVVFIATENNSLYAFDADTGGSPLWHVNFGTPMPYTVCCASRDLFPQIGITSTPVIDMSSGLLYVVAETYVSGTANFTLHAIDITTGADKLTPAVIAGSVPGNGTDNVGGVVTFKALNEWQRPGLLLLNGNVYFAFGSHQDANPYHGWLFGYSAAALQQTAIFNFSRDSEESGVWQGGVAPAADANGNIYLETGNGALTVNTGGRDYGDSIVKIGTSGTPAILDYFSPNTESADDANDWDLGSSGPLLIPGTSLGIAGGKDGKLYIFNTANLGQFHAGADQIVQEWQATFAYAGGVGGFWGGNYIYYNSTVYGFGERDFLKTWAFNGSQFSTTAGSQSTFMVPASGISNDPAMSISANGTVAGTAIVWAAFSSDGIADGSVQPGVFYAFDASNVATVLWNSNQNSAQDSSGSWAKWCPPIVANGKVYLASFDNVVNVYGLLAASSGGGTLTGSGTSATTAVSLTAEGSADWVHWGDASLNRKAGVTPQITTYSVIGGGGTQIYTNDARTLSWSDGTPTATGSNTNGLYTSGTGIGFSFTAPADTTTRVLTVHVGGYSGSGTLTAHLSDRSAPNYVDNTTVVSGLYDRNYTLTYSAASAGQTLSVSWVTASGTGNADLNGAALSQQSGTSISATAGTPQTATVNNAFASTLQATVKDANNNPLSGVTVTFTAPATGAGAAFSGSATATATTNATGIAIAPALTANSKAGSYTVTASAPGAGGTASFSLTNLAAAPASVAATAGTPQTAAVNAVFATALQATVKDSSSNPVSGVTVTFTAPATGASAAFGGSATATATTNASGVATSPKPTANSQAGAYTVTASAAGVATTASFSLTNTAQTAGSISASAGTPQSASVNSAFATALQATVKDTNNNPMSGVSVTFTAPASGAGAAFSGSATATATTNASGIAIAPGLTANGQAGAYTVTASAAGVATPANFSLTNTAVSTSGGALTGSGTSASTASSLTTVGPTDWVHWGDASLNRKAGVTAQISTYSVVGSGTVHTYSNDPRTLSWSDGTPTATGSNDTGLYISGTKNGFSFTVPADTTTRVLSVYVGGWNSSGTLTAHLSDGSAADFVNTTTAASAQYDGNYTLSYNAASAGQTITISWVMASGAGNVTLNGAALSSQQQAGTATISASAGTPQSAIVNSAFTTALQATVKDAGNNPMSGVTVTFAAPATGAGAAFSGSATATATTNASGIAIAPALTANSQTGTYSVTASATGVATTASFSLTNLAQTPSSITATAGTPQSATVNSAFTTALQATVKDAGNNPVSGVTVTFTAPATGASAAFSGSATATATTNASGIAIAPALTANSQTGTYTVTASAAGVATAASFSLTNLAQTPSSISASAGTPQSATVNSAFATALQATVKDSSNNPVSGVSVTFTAPATGAGAAFSGSATATTTTNASGIAIAPGLTANGQAGAYTVTASAAGVATPANFSLTNTVVSAGGGALTGSGTSASTASSLTAVGPTDWVHWGDASLTRKAGVTAKISTYSPVGSGAAHTYNNDPRTLSWSDGTPTATGSNDSGLYISGTKNGFSFTVPADTTTRVLSIYVGGWNSSGTLTAHLSDGSAADFVDTTTAASAQYDRNYTLTYNAASAGQTITISWVMASGAGNVTLNGAAF
jgi:Bacterial Ig-like domain (group 1)